MFEIKTLPLIRQDLKIYPADHSESGAPTWTLYDPSREFYFQIGILDLEILSRWHLKDPLLILKKIEEQTLLRPTPEDLLKILIFLKNNNLLYDQWISAPLAKIRYQPFKKLIDRLVFTRIAIFTSPQFLKNTSHYFDWIFTAGFFKIVVISFFLSLYLLSREWDLYINQFSYLFTVEGLITGLLVLAFSKVCHEMGHAYVSTRNGIPVPEIGIAFVLFWPMLYTNTTHAWKVKDRNVRVKIDSAGVITELLIAIFFTLLWCVLPESSFRGAVWYLSSTAWLVTLGVNLNPLMRFDGYYLLADYLHMPNLMARSILMAKWWVKTKFSILEPAPEIVQEKKRNLMIAYGLLCVLYRMTILIAIIVAIYFLFFKALALVIVLLTLWYYILSPFKKYLISSGQLYSDFFRSENNKRIILAIFILFVGFFFPLPTLVRIPAVAVAMEDSKIHSPIQAYIEKNNVFEGSPVKKGEVILKLVSPDLENRKKIIEVRARAYEVQLARQAATSSFRESRQVLSEQYAEALAEINGINDLLVQLEVIAQHDGIVRDISNLVHVGAWVSPKEQLLRVVGSGVIAEGYLPESNVTELYANKNAKFYPDSPSVSTFEVTVLDVEPVRTTRLNRRILSSTEGGEIHVRYDDRGNLLPIESVYRIRSSAKNKTFIADSIMRGQIVLEGDWKSLFVIFTNLITSQIIKESNF